MQDCWSFTCCHCVIVEIQSSLVLFSLFSFYRYCFGRCSTECLNWFYFLILGTGLLVILIDCMIFLSPFPDVTRMSMSTGCQQDVNSFFLRTVRLWNSLPIECFPLTYELSGPKSRINRHLLTAGFF